MKLWICGKYCGEPNDWEFIGVFDSEQKAVDACQDFRELWVAPATLNEEIDHGKRTTFPGAYYPNIKEDDDGEKEKS